MTAAAVAPLADVIPHPVPFGYLRISQDRTGEMASPGRQRKEQIAKARSLGYDPASIRWYAEAKSATKGPRPEFDRMMADIADGQCAVLLVWVADRLWRDEDDDLAVRKVFRAAKIWVRTCRGVDLDFTTAEGRMLGKVVGATSEYEVERKKERQLIANLDSAQKGRWAGGPRRFGWEQKGTRLVRHMDDETGVITEEKRPSGRLTLVDKEAEAIRDGMQMIMDGQSVNQVTRNWRERGLTGVQGGVLAAETVRQILLRPANAGLSFYKGQPVGRTEWPAIPGVTEDTWATVRTILTADDRRTNTTSAGRPPAYLLSGILRCGVCGNPMRSSSNSKRQNYRCGAGRDLIGSGGLRHANRQRRQLNDAITSAVLAWISANADQLQQPAQQTAATKALNTEVIKLNGKITAFEHDADNWDDPAQLRRIIGGLVEKRDAIQAKITKNAGKPHTARLIAAARGEGLHVAWSRLTVTQQRSVLSELIDRIEVGPGQVGGSTVPGARDPMHNVVIFDHDGREMNAAA